MVAGQTWNARVSTKIMLSDSCCGIGLGQTDVQGGRHISRVGEIVPRPTPRLSATVIELKLVSMLCADRRRHIRNFVTFW
jgi:hypothetical protein